jgi:hypothetical protein
MRSLTMLLLLLAAPRAAAPAQRPDAASCESQWVQYQAQLGELRERAAKKYPGAYVIEQGSKEELLTIDLVNPYGNGGKPYVDHSFEGSYPVVGQLFVRTTETPEVPDDRTPAKTIFTLEQEAEDHIDAVFSVTADQIPGENQVFVHVQYGLTAGEGHFFFILAGPLCAEANAKGTWQMLHYQPLGKEGRVGCMQYRNIGFSGPMLAEVAAFRVYRSPIAPPSCPKPQ